MNDILNVRDQLYPSLTRSLSPSRVYALGRRNMKRTRTMSFKLAPLIKSFLQSRRDVRVRDVTQHLAVVVVMVSAS